MKGQAFDTFKLMIAAVVAVAILGILMGILGQIQTPGADPMNIMKDQLTKAYNYPGTTVVSSSSAAFTKGTIYSGDSFTSSLGGAGTITFVCSTTYSSACTVGTKTLTINSGFSAKIKACCKGSTAPTCKIGIGEDAAITCP